MPNSLQGVRYSREVDCECVSWTALTYDVPKLRVSLSLIMDIGSAKHEILGAAELLLTFGTIPCTMQLVSPAPKWVSTGKT
jgi:hypothetical protein